ncbi:MAG: [citrate (pro-3S)-lyase] ligase [Acholeplasmataceae bacterium]|nr:MAG: [citrate (pro-3S)-lyase] ligase [Acholeplasmataceae bacterium]
MMYRVVDCKTPLELKDVRALLTRFGLSFESQVDHTIGLYDGRHMIATGSVDHNVIKMIAVDEQYQGENLTADILSRLINHLAHKGITKHFLFTTPASKPFFTGFPYQLVFETDTIVLFENNMDVITDQLTGLAQALPPFTGRTGALVMNCNPVTNGHLHLIETCARASDRVLLFLVETDASLVPYPIRFDLVKEATSHLPNVYLLPSTPYIISRSTFPTYFLKELSDASLAYMQLDIGIFDHYFMPLFKIDKRYVADEPHDPMTHAYNQTMQTILKDRLVMIPRLETGGQAISASWVRMLAKNRQYDVLKPLVPDATYRFLISKEGRSIFDA